MAIKKNISAIRLEKWEKEIPFENIWIKVNKNGEKSLYINVVYLRSGFESEHLNIYLNHLSEITLSKDPNSKFLIIGDFNLSCINWINIDNRCIAGNYEGNNATNLIDTFTLTDLDQRNHIRNKYGKILDLVVSNFDLHIKNTTEKIVNEDDYHPALSIKFSSDGIKFIKPIRTFKRNFMKADFEPINNKLSTFNWSTELDYNDVNSALERFNFILNDILNDHIPLIKPRSSDFPKWFSYKLISLIKEKERYHKLSKRNNSDAYKQMFISKRKETKEEKKKCYFKYLNNIENLITKNPKCFFAYTKAIK